MEQEEAMWKSIYEKLHTQKSEDHSDHEKRWVIKLMRHGIPVYGSVEPRYLSHDTCFLFVLLGNRKNFFIRAWWCVNIAMHSANVTVHLDN